MVVKRTFASTLDPVDAFGLSNELLRPRGFTLDKGTPPRSQSWRRGVQPGKKVTSVFNAPQTIELEFNSGKINVSATAATTGRKATQAQGMLTAYVDAVERILAAGETPAAAARGPRLAERTIRRAALTRSMSICSIIIAVIGGAAIGLTKVPGVPNPIKWLSATSGGNAQADAKSRKSPPVVVVRRVGTQTHAAPAKDTGDH